LKALREWEQSDTHQPVEKGASKVPDTFLNGLARLLVRLLHWFSIATSFLEGAHACQHAGGSEFL
jgi:hypothetical protein